MGYELENLIVNIVSLGFVFVGGCFGLWQYQKGQAYKRTDMVKSLIKNVREDQQVSIVIDIIDWDEGFSYDGKFHINQRTMRDELKSLSDEKLFRMIDYTLSTFSYICYLRRMHTISQKEMLFFKYEIRRLADNEHISNYLYSLYHWSKSLNVEMSFSYLVDYCLKEKLLQKEFTEYGNRSDYHCYLYLSSTYTKCE